MKYLYKYITKGPDYLDINIRRSHNEIANHINGRYLCAPKAVWRLLKFKNYDRSHTVVCLQVHEQNQQNIYYREDVE